MMRGASRISSIVKICSSAVDALCAMIIDTLKLLTTNVLSSDPDGLFVVEERVIYNFLYFNNLTMI
jgi:hypothetical protein